MSLGAHLPTSKGFVFAVQEAQRLGLGCLQIFSKSPRQWNAPPLDPLKVAQFREAWDAAGLAPLVVHDSYLINLAAPDETVREKSIAAMVDELKRAEALGCDYLVTHCGAHLKTGEEVGVAQLAASVARCLEETADLKVKITLENTAAQGTTLGGPFHHIGAVLKTVNSPRLSVCLDTCHALAAGHDIVGNLESVLADFDAEIGLKNLGVVHLNDSKGVLGGHLDRHEHIGLGQIGREAMRAILTHARLKDLPFILETPEVDTKIAENIAMVRELQGF